MMLNLKLKRLIFLSLLVLIVVIRPANAQNIYKLFFLAGQSNMEGLGKVSDLPNELAGGVPGVIIYHSNPVSDNVDFDGRGIWAPLKPGHGYGFSTDGTGNSYSELFGPELTFAQRLKELQPDENIALIKYARSGTSIDLEASMGFGCWDPDYRDGNGLNQYDHFLATVKKAMFFKDIDNDGLKDMLEPAGIIWMQGESDAAYTEEIARRYENNLKRLINQMRTDIGVNNLPVVIGQISDSGKDVDGKVWNYSETVRNAQKTFVENDEYAALVSETDKYGYTDTAHYDTMGVIELGRRFAEEIVQLNEKLEQ
jgi:hypothetical protein